MRTEAAAMPALPTQNKILPLRVQAEMRNRWIKQRLHDLLPKIMAEEGYDMWIIACREYNEDPVIMTMLPASAMNARRRTILIFCRQADGTVERLALDRYGHGDFYIPAWNPDEETQDNCLLRLVSERKPKTIGLNFSYSFAFADGLSFTEYVQVLSVIGDQFAEQIKPAGRLCLRWLESRIEPELAIYPDLVAHGHAIISQAYSSKVIQPGSTTTEDVVWWMRQKMADLGLKAWFQPSIEIQAPGQTFGPIAGGDKATRRSLIMPGDLLHCDMGFIYLGLATDQQQHAYILKDGETEAPAGIQGALAIGNRLQEIHFAHMQIGRTGNEILTAVLAQAKEEGIKATVYSHPLGYHGHAAGPTIGLWDQQDRVPGRGDYELHDNTCYSIELNIVHEVSEWDNQPVVIALEEDAVLSAGKMRWLDGRQTKLHLIG